MDNVVGFMNNYPLDSDLYLLHNNQAQTSRGRGRQAGLNFPLPLPCTTSSCPFRRGSCLFVLFLLQTIIQCCKFFPISLSSLSSCSYFSRFQLRNPASRPPFSCFQKLPAPIKHPSYIVSTNLQ